MDNNLDYVELMFYEQPEELHKVLHMMRIGQDALLKLTLKTNKIVKGSGAEQKEITTEPLTLKDNELLIGEYDNKFIVVTYEVTDDIATNEFIHDMQAFVDKVDYIDDHFELVSYDDIKSLDLSKPF